MHSRRWNARLFAIEEAKKMLSAHESATIFASDDDLGMRDKNGKDIYVEITVKRADYEAHRRKSRRVGGIYFTAIAAGTRHPRRYR